MCANFKVGSHDKEEPEPAKERQQKKHGNGFNKPSDRIATLLSQLPKITTNVDFDPSKPSAHSTSSSNQHTLPSSRSETSFSSEALTLVNHSASLHLTPPITSSDSLQPHTKIIMPEQSRPRSPSKQPTSQSLPTVPPRPLNRRIMPSVWMRNRTSPTRSMLVQAGMIREEIISKYENTTLNSAQWKGLRAGTFGRLKRFPCTRCLRTDNPPPFSTCKTYVDRNGKELHGCSTCLFEGKENECSAMTG